MTKLFSNICAHFKSGTTFALLVKVAEGAWMISSRGCCIAAVVLAAALLGTGRAQATMLDTTYAWNGISYIGTFGYQATSTYGQTFIAPSNTLDDFTFYLEGPGSGSPNAQFQAQVYSWTGGLLGGGTGQAIGPPLYTSSPISIGATANFVPVTVSTGGVTLIPGNPYVALFTISGPDSTNFTNTTDAYRLGLLSTHSNFPDGAVHVPGSGGGGFVFYNNGSNYAALNSTTWDNSADFGDAAWTAHFSGNVNPPPPSVPEPATITIFGAGLAGLWISRRRKRA